MKRAPKERARPTQRLSPEQEAARKWWHQMGLDHQADRAIEDLALSLHTQRSDPLMAARLERVELDLLKRHFRGSQDIAGVALAIYELQEAGIIAPFEWVADAGDWNKGTIRELDDLLYNRVNNCFCFLNLCAWLAGSQPLNTDNIPLISHDAWGKPGGEGYQLLIGAPLPGQIVLNHIGLPFLNNPDGFHHIGVVVAGGEVVHLSSKDLHKDPLDAVFTRIRNNTYVGEFDWVGFEGEYRPVTASP